MREIGGYFELERFGSSSYHPSALSLNCGRGCLAYLVELRSISVVWIPDYLCDSVSALMRREGAEVKTYQVGEDFRPRYGFKVDRGEWLLLVDYFGQLNDRDIEKAREVSQGCLIVDESHGFFRRAWQDADTIYTCRKWFGVADGAYLYTKDGKKLCSELPVDESHERMNFVMGRFERTASEFFAESKANNALFAYEPAKRMSHITANLLSAVDYESVATRRRENWSRLAEALGDENLLVLDESEVPFMYPLLLEGVDAGEVRKRLAQMKVYIPKLWPNVEVESDPSSIAFRYARDIILLPVDQRYSADDMEYLLQVLKKVKIDF